MARKPMGEVVHVEPLGTDLVNLAWCLALDASTFPHASIPPLHGYDPLMPARWIARVAGSTGVMGFLATSIRGPVLYISGLAVVESWRRMGVGRALLAVAIATARRQGFSALVLHVSTGNDAAIRLYHNENFRILKRAPGFYSAEHFPDRGDAFEMALLLS